MKIYDGEFLTITLENENNGIVQQWIKSPETIDAFKKEMLVFRDVFLQQEPVQGIWLSQNFALDLDAETQRWVEDNINRPIYDRLARLTVAFDEYNPLVIVVGEEAMRDIDIMDLLEGENKSCIVPRYFATEKEAREWLSAYGSDTDIRKIPNILLYEGDFLTVTYERKRRRMRQEWVAQPDSVESFKNEMLMFKKMFFRCQAAQSMWIWGVLATEVDEEIQIWIETNIVRPININALYNSRNKEGFDPVAIVVGEDVMKYMGVIDTFESSRRSLNYPKHFATEEEAREWLDSFEAIESEKVIYQSDFLHINLETYRQRFVVEWVKTPTIEEFKKEVTVCTDFALEHKAEQVLWLMQNIKPMINNELVLWMEKYVSQPILKAVVERTGITLNFESYTPFAFVLREDTFFKLSALNAGETATVNKYFLDQSQADKWLNSTPLLAPLSELPQETGEVNITYKGVDRKGQAVIELKSPASDIRNTLQLFKDHLLEQQAFISANIEKYIALSERERDIMARYARGEKPEAISEELNLSLHTVRTHWRNVKKKLGIESYADIAKYITAFKIK